MTQVAQHLPRKYKTLSSNPILPKKKKPQKTDPNLILFIVKWF
jgi:hypothetical protein